jgi:hypothetical protein
MSSMLWVGGRNRYTNALARGMVTAPVLSPAADANKPITNAYDGDPGNVFAWGSLVADSYASFDMNYSINGGIESALGAEWTDRSVGASNVAVRSTTTGPPNDYYQGAAGLKCTMVTTGGSNIAGRSQDYIVRSGETWVTTFARRGDGTRIARAQLRNMMTGNYWSGSVWQSAATDFDASVSSTTWAVFGPTGIVVEENPSGQPELCEMTLRLTLYVNGASAGSVFFDEVYCWPAVSLVGFFGHRNLSGLVSVQIKRDTAAITSAGTLDSTIAAFPQAFYAKLAAVRIERFWQLKVLGTPLAIVNLGELFFGQYRAASTMPVYPLDVGRTYPQARSTNRLLASPLTDRPLRTWAGQFTFGSAANVAEMRERIIGATRGGVDPLVLVPQDDDASLILYGRIPAEWMESQQFLSKWDGKLEIEEFPLFTLVA